MRTHLPLLLVCALAGPLGRGADNNYLIMVPHAVEGAPGCHRWGSGRAVPDRTLKKHLEEAGFATYEIAAFSPEVNVEYLKQFDLVVLGAGGEGNQSALFNEVGDRVAGQLLEYVRQGGGLLWMRTPGWQYGKDIEEFNRWLEPTGARILDEQVVDPEYRVEMPSRAVLQWTDNIVEHAVTVGLTGIWYPEVYSRGFAVCSDFTSPVETSADWQVLIRGKKTAKSVHTTKGPKIVDPEPGSIASAPPILAVREYGKGRIALMPMASGPIWQDAYHVFWGGGFAMDGSRKGMPGHGLRLILNLFSWLGEPGGADTGGYVPKPPPPRPRDVGFIEYNWDEMKVKPVQRSECMKGLIGARSELSVGTGKPAQFIAAAKAAGYNFIAFTENFEELTEAEFAQLKETCAAASDESFAAYPGFRYLDDSGNAWVTFSDKLTWPKPSWMSKTHKGRLSVNNTLSRGWNWPPIIFLLPTKNPEPAWCQGNFRGISLYTYDDGKLVDEGVGVYRRLAQNAFAIMPFAVHLVDSPAEVAAAAAGQQSYVRWYERNAINAITSRPKWQGNAVHYWSTFTSEGPIMEDGHTVNFGMSDLALRGNDRLRIHLRFSAPAGLREVALYDGVRPAPVRRWLLDGEQVFETSQDFYHERQHDFIPIATDTEGRTMVGWRMRTIVQENAFLRCGDNYNTMPRGKWWGEPKHMMNIGGFENYMVTRNFRYFGSPRFPGLEESGRPAIEYHPVMACRFGMIIETSFDHHYPKSASGNSDKTDLPECAVPNESIGGTVTYTYFTCHQDGPLIELVEGDLTLKQTIEARGAHIYNALGREDTWNVVATEASGRVFGGHLTEELGRYTGEIAVNGYAALYPNPYRGALGLIPLTPGITYYGQRRPGWPYGGLIGMMDVPKDHGTGDRFTYRYLGVIGPLGGPPTTEFCTDIIDKLGLDGTPSYKITPTRGTVTGTRFILDLASEDHAWSGRIGVARDLPLALPVRVAGLNPNWDAGILYCGKTTLLVDEWIWDDEYSERYCEARPREVENELIHLPVLADGTGFCQVDTAIGRKRLFIGNLLVADSPDVCLLLIDHRPGRVTIEVHNPTNARISCTVRPAPGFSLIPAFAQQVELAAGTSTIIHPH